MQLLTYMTSSGPSWKLEVRGGPEPACFLLNLMPYTGVDDQRFDVCVCLKSHIGEFKWNPCFVAS